MFPLRHGALFVVFCAEPACSVKNVHLLLCIFAAAPPHGVHGLKSSLIIQDIHGILSRTPHGAHGLKFIVLTQVQSGRVAASLHGIEKKCSKGVLSE